MELYQKRGLMGNKVHDMIAPQSKRDGEFMDKMDDLQKAIETINKKIDEIIRIKLGIKNDYQILLLYYLIRLNEAVKSILIIINNQLFEDALIICRSIFEIAINLEYIKDDKITGTQRISNTAQDELRKIQDEFNNTQTPKIPDTLPSIIERAKNISPGKPSYSMVYRILCQSAHITLERMRKYLHCDEKSGKITGVQPNIKDKEKILKTMAIVIDKILNEVLEEFDLKAKYLTDYLVFRHYVDETFK